MEVRNVSKSEFFFRHLLRELARHIGLPNPLESFLTGDYLSDASAETDFQRTMVWDCELDFDEGLLKKLTESGLEAIFKAHNLAVDIADGADLDGLSEKDSRRINYMMNCAKGRSLILTHSTSMSMTQNNVRPEDHVFIISGNSHPVVLTPSEKYADT